MIPAILSPYSPKYASTLVYMLQNTEYHVLPYLRWYWRTQHFATVERRRQLVETQAARLLRLALWCGMGAQVIVGALFVYLWLRYGMIGGWAFGAAIIVSYPVVWAHVVVVPLVLGRVFITKPREAKQVVDAERIFRTHKGTKIAVAGSYGKTSMKEILSTVLREGKMVAATPANKNVALSHAVFARSLTGKEDVLIIEYGEGAPGDVARFGRTTHPTHAVITGVAAAHLDQYKTVEAAGKDIFSIAQFIEDKGHVYVNAESAETRQFMESAFKTYDRRGALGWKVTDIAISVNRTVFTLRKGKKVLHLRSGLLGRHQVGPLAFAAALAKEFGLTDEQVTKSIARTSPFEHRMQSYQLQGAWVIDDTYNGNIEGIRAGTELLRELPAQRKLYVTPGLVDQGKETAAIHEEMGRLIAHALPDIVILMRNSVTEYIQKGLAAAAYEGEVRVEENPAQFYMNLNHFIAAGDLVLMQNDWPDNYA